MNFIALKFESENYSISTLVFIVVLGTALTGLFLRKINIKLKV